MSEINLQATLSSSSATGTGYTGIPHHPITCPSELRYYEDGSFECAHAKVPADDGRTQACVIHSVALLLIEIATATL